MGTGAVGTGTTGTGTTGTGSGAAPARSNQENLTLLERLRPDYERLKAERIRAEGEIERLGRELEAARLAARAEFGTDDEGEIAAMIAVARARDAALVDAFAEALRAVESRLAALRDPA